MFVQQTRFAFCAIIIVLSIVGAQESEREVEYEADQQPRASNEKPAIVPVNESGKPQSVRPPGNSDVYVDQILSRVRQQTRDSGSDPLQLKVKERSFKKKLFGKAIKGGIRLKSGLLSGLSTLHRIGSTNLQYTDNKLTLEGVIGVNDLSASYDLTAWFTVFKIHGGASATVSSASAYIKLSQNSGEDEEGVPVLEDFDIREVGKIKTKVTGLGPLGWTLNRVTECLVNALKEIIADEMEVKIRRLIAAEIHKVKFDF